VRVLPSASPSSADATRQLTRIVTSASAGHATQQGGDTWVLPIETNVTTSSGSLASLLAATAETGELLVRKLVDHLLDILDMDFTSPAVVAPCDSNINI
jgi:hypothetical protein